MLYIFLFLFSSNLCVYTSAYVYYQRLVCEVPWQRLGFTWYTVCRFIPLINLPGAISSVRIERRSSNKTEISKSQYFVLAHKNRQLVRDFIRKNLSYRSSFFTQTNRTFGWGNCVLKYMSLDSTLDSIANKMNV